MEKSNNNMKQVKFSLIIPCYNEQGNISELVRRCKDYFSGKEFEVIFVDNGSTDKTYDILKSKTRQIANFRILKIDKNQGIGLGITKGLKSSKGNIIAWTHGDLQTDPKDVLEGFQLSKDFSGDFLIKGKRKIKNRTILEYFFTVGMSIFESILHLRLFWDINGQPNIFTRSFFNTWKSPPNDYQIDLYCFQKAKKNNILIYRFDVEFKKRVSGTSKWNTGIYNKINFIHRTVIYSFKLRFFRDVNN